MLPHLQTCVLVAPEIRDMASAALITSKGKENIPIMPTPLAFSCQPTLTETSHLPLNPTQLCITASASSESLFTPSQSSASIDSTRPSKHQCTADTQREFNEDFCKMLIA